MLDKINGLPAHVLLVHAVIVLLPLAALALVASVLWPALRRRLGVLVPLLALVALVFVPITTHAGEWLRNHLPPGLAQTPLVQQHVRLGHTLLPWAAAIFVVAAVVWLLDRRATSPTWVAAAVALVAIVVSVGGVYQLYRIGDSGAKAVWTGNFSQTATTRAGG